MRTRVSYRLADQITMRARIGGEPALIYGAGVGGAGAVREMLSNPAVGLTPAGFIDDDPARAGKSVNGYPILGSVDQPRRGRGAQCREGRSLSASRQIRGRREVAPGSSPSLPQRRRRSARVRLGAGCTSDSKQVRSKP